MKSILQLLVSIILAVMSMQCTSATNPAVDTVSAIDFQKGIAQSDNVYILDVRTPQEYAQGHIPGATQLDWLDNATFKKEAPQMLPKSDTIYVYCRSGRRSAEAADYLASLGYKVVDLDGGILGWQRASLPVVQ